LLGPALFAHFVFQRRLDSLSFVGYMHCEVLLASVLALCPRVEAHFPVIIFCLEKAEMIINVIRTFCIGIFFTFGIVSQCTDCSPNLVAEYLAVSDDLVETFVCQSGFERLILGNLPK
jgi:hypothetical protein